MYHRIKFLGKKEIMIKKMYYLCNIRTFYIIRLRAYVINTDTPNKKKILMFIILIDL